MRDYVDNGKISCVQTAIMRNGKIIHFNSYGYSNLKTKELIKINDGEFKYHLDRYKYSKRYDNEDPEFHRKKCLKFIESLNNELNNSKYIFDNNISYVDIVLLPFIRQFRIADMEWFDSLPYDNIKDWLSKFLDSFLLNIIMKKYDLWKEEDEITIF